MSIWGRIPAAFLRETIGESITAILNALERERDMRELRERQLHQLEAQLRALFEALPDWSIARVKGE